MWAARCESTGNSAARHLDLPGWQLHQLRCDLAVGWSVTVISNWRIIFRFEQGDLSKLILVAYN
jgi:toxin HigB-1